MFQQTGDQLHYDMLIMWIAKQPNPFPVSPLQHQRKHYGDDMGNCGKAKTKRLKLEDLPIQGYAKARSRIRVDRNLEHPCG